MKVKIISELKVKIENAQEMMNDLEALNSLLVRKKFKDKKFKGKRRKHDRRSMSWWHSSPPCLDGSIANISHGDMKRFIRQTRWTLVLFGRCRPGRWTMEQIDRIRRYVCRICK